jgi:predicted LPLAT superfamily acyltransferase
VSAQWRGRRERGSVFLKRFIIMATLRGGRGLGRAMLYPIVAYFVATAPTARRASREFLGRALGRPATLLDVYRHIHTFAATLLDRVFLVHGRTGELDVSVTNEHLMDEALAQGRGCLLLGSHLGSFEMLAVMGSVDRGLRVNMVMHLDDTAGLRELLAGQALTIPYEIIPLGQPGSMLRVAECLERGEVVGILADRVYGAEKTRTIPFLGAPARFSMSPFRLAALTRVPVVAVYGIYRGGRKYEVRFEPLASSEPEPYVAALEERARDAPYNWFNFFDYWRP